MVRSLKQELENLPLARFNTNGTLDSSFGINGIIANTSLQGYSVALQNDGKIILGGSEGSQILMRFKSNGTLDSSFGTDGIVSNALLESLYCTAIQADGKIIAGGYPYIARFDSTGALDSSFGNEGFAESSANLGLESSNGIVFQNDGKILAACNGDMVVRYNINGTFDSSFGTNGIVGSNSPNFSFFDIFSVALENDGKILITGNDTSSINPETFETARLSALGVIDTSFGNKGYVITPIGDLNGTAYSILLYSNKIYAAGIAGGSSGLNFAIVSYNNDAGALPVSLLNFNGIEQNGQAILTWETTNEINNKGFDVEKSNDGKTFAPIGFVAGLGTEENVNNYTFSDPKLISGNNYYRLKQINFDESYNYSPIIDLTFDKFSWSILGNSSNTPVVEIQLDKQYTVVIQIVSINGDVIKTINEGVLNEGTYSIPLNLNNEASGMYIVRLIVKNQSFSKNVLR